MTAFDNKNNITQLSAVDIQAIASNTTTNGNEIDTQFYESLDFILQAGDLNDGDYTLLIEDTNTSGSGYAAVADDFLVGTEADTQVSASNEITRIGYVGKKRYVRASIVSANTTSGGTVGSIAILGKFRHSPTA